MSDEQDLLMPLTREGVLKLAAAAGGAGLWQAGSARPVQRSTG